MILAPCIERWAVRGLVVAALLCAACKPPAAATVEVKPNLEVRSGPTVAFDFPTLDGQHLSTETVAGRISVIGFVTAYDDPSLVQARFLVALAKHHTPRINVALLFLDPPENRPLVEVFVSSLKLKIPAAIADAATVAGDGPFVGLHHVPSVVILDRNGSEAFRNIGLIEEHDIDEAVKKLETQGR